MAYNILTEANKYSVAYSPIPYRFKDDEVGTSNNYNYINFLVIEPVTISFGAIADNFTNTIYTTTEPHGLKIGDNVFIYSDIEYVYETVVIERISDVSVKTKGFGYSLPGNAKIGKYINYKKSPDLEGECKSLYNTILKDYVSTQFNDTNEVYDGSDTKVKYELININTTQPVFEFDDDYFLPALGFDLAFIKYGAINEYNTVYDNFNNGEVNIYDRQGAYEYYDVVWTNYNGLNYFVYIMNGNTYLDVNALDGSYTTTANSSIIIEPDNTNSADAGTYNSFNAYGNSNGGGAHPYSQIWVQTSASDTTGVYNSGTIYGQVNIPYNGNTTVRAITTANGTDLVIGVNKNVGYGTDAISGKMKLINTEKVSTTILYSSGDKYAYVGRQNPYEYNIDFFEEYVLTDEYDINQTKVSTIYNPQTPVRVEINTKQWLLYHFDVDITERYAANVLYYNKSGNLLGKMETLIDPNKKDFYIPVGLEQWTDKTLVLGANLSTVINDVDYYYLGLDYNSTNGKFTPIRFNITDDCSSYDLYEIIWKDALGSYISYPFAYKHKEVVEVSRSTYYKDVNGFKDDNSYSIDTYAKGSKEFFNKSKEKFTLNSGWATDVESEYIKDMFLSADVYVKMPDGTIRGCNILDNNMEVKKQQNFDLFNYKINIVTSQQDIRL